MKLFFLALVLTTIVNGSCRDPEKEVSKRRMFKMPLAKELENRAEDGFIEAMLPSREQREIRIQKKKGKPKPCKYNKKKYKAGQVIEAFEDQCLEFICSEKGRKTEHRVMENCVSGEGPQCPAGFFRTIGSSQCYKFFGDQLRIFSEAKEKCETEKLQLAEPRNPVEVRYYLVEVLGNERWVYLGAQGDGTAFVWGSNGEKISNTSPYWSPGQPQYTNTDACLQLMSHTPDQFEKDPYKPFFAGPCGWYQYTLCEGCPEGFFRVPPSLQCFKRFSEGLSWQDAAINCLQQGLQLARPADEIAVALRKYLLDTYGGSHYTWVGGRGNGTRQDWAWDGTVVNKDLMWPGAYEEVSTDRCLSFGVWEDMYEKYPDRPYSTYFCTDPRIYLCEQI